MWHCSMTNRQNRAFIFKTYATVKYRDKVSARQHTVCTSHIDCLCEQSLYQHCSGIVNLVICSGLSHINLCSKTCVCHAFTFLWTIKCFYMYSHTNFYVAYKNLPKELKVNLSSGSWVLCHSCVMNVLWQWHQWLIQCFSNIFTPISQV